MRPRERQPTTPRRLRRAAREPLHVPARDTGREQAEALEAAQPARRLALVAFKLHVLGTFIPFWRPKFDTSYLCHKKTDRKTWIREGASMNDDRREVIPFLQGDEVRQATPLAPHPVPLPDADRRRLEALLRELLRDNSLRELLCNERA
jgi:hypothetical protein